MSEVEASVRRLVECLARGLVDSPEQVEVLETAKAGTLACDIRVAPGDVGKVIGRQGRVVTALRTVANAVAAAHGHRAYVEIDG